MYPHFIQEAMEIQEGYVTWSQSWFVADEEESMQGLSAKTLIWKGMCTPLFIAALFTIAKTWNQPKCPSTDE